MTKLVLGLSLAGIGTTTPTVLPTALDHRGQIDALAVLIGTTPEEIKARRLLPAQLSFAPKSRAIDFFGLRMLAAYREGTVRRVSPRALRRSPFHRAIWDLRLLNFDIETLEPLTDHCPVCKKPLGWEMARGVSHCDKCFDERGLPAVDLRDYPQEPLQVDDPSALAFVAELVSPTVSKRERLASRLPDCWKDQPSDRVFEGIARLSLALAGSGLANPRSLTRRRSDFKLVTPNILATAARAILNGHDGVVKLKATLAGEFELAPNGASHLGVLESVAGVEYAPEGYSAPPKHYPSKGLSFVNSGEVTLIKSLSIGTRDGKDKWQSHIGLASEMHVSSPALRLLAESGFVPSKKTDVEFSTEYLLRASDIRPFVALHKDLCSKSMILRKLSIDECSLGDLIAAGMLRPANGRSLAMVRNGTHFSNAAAGNVLKKLAAKARHLPPDAKTISIESAVSKLAEQPPRWSQVMQAILTDRIEVYRRPPGYWYGGVVLSNL